MKKFICHAKVFGIQADKWIVFCLRNAMTWVRFRKLFVAA